jgi:hypothetical protein
MSPVPTLYFTKMPSKTASCNCLKASLSPSKAFLKLSSAATPLSASVNISEPNKVFKFYKTFARSSTLAVLSSKTSIASRAASALSSKTFKEALCYNN